MRSLVACVLCVIVLGNSPLRAADELPAEAKELLTTFEQDLIAIQKKAEEDIKARRVKLAEALEKLQVEYTKKGELDPALAIREVSRAIKAGAFGTQKGPENMAGYRDQVGKVFFFEVVGGSEFSCYGSDIYTDDSRLSTAAVHAGVLKNGQKGVVKVTVLPGQASYSGSSRNGIISAPWFSWAGSYKVESLDAKPVVIAPK